MPRFVRSRWFAGVALLFVAFTVAAVTMSGNADATDTALTAVVSRGEFKVQVKVAGELQALSSIELGPPTEGMRVGLYNMKISSIVPEGTLVDSGDVVAELDRSMLLTQQNNYAISFQKAQAVFDQARLDTTLNMSKAREDLRNLESALEERTIAVDQARYEAPSIRRQAELEKQKAERALEQAKKDYVTRESQAQAKMREVSAEVDRNRMFVEQISTIADQLTIRAPSPGMVIYIKEYNGRKRGVGSNVGPYSGGGVATLPDLTRMLTLCYVNEIDIRRIAIGQRVSITLDSDPTKRLTGKVTEVANVGEERPNSDAKVFEVKIEIAESDTTLRPGMTTANAIETASFTDVLTVPLEAVTSENNVPFVFVRKGGNVVKQEVTTGDANETHIMITAGVDEGDVVLLIPPENHATLELQRLAGAAPPDTGSGSGNR